MNDEYDFNDLLTIDATQWGSEIDPLGLMAYANHKRRRFYTEEKEIEQWLGAVVIGYDYDEKNEILTLKKRHLPSVKVKLSTSDFRHMNNAGPDGNPLNWKRFLNQKKKKGELKLTEEVEQIDEVTSNALNKLQQYTFASLRSLDWKLITIDKDKNAILSRPDSVQGTAYIVIAPDGKYERILKDKISTFRKMYESVEQIDEVLTLQQRMKRKILMRRLAPRIARARKIAMRKRAGNDVLKNRAKSAARRAMATKLLGGRNKADVSPSERARVEKILAKRKKGIDRLAVKMLPLVRKKQAARFANKAAAAHKKPAPKPVQNSSTTSTSSSK